MSDNCCSIPAAGCDTCELPSASIERSKPAVGACPVCHAIGKPVQNHTVKAMLAVTLRSLQEDAYLFCKTQSCPVVYFSVEGGQTFALNQVRERVYQKEPETDEVFICYCFRHTVGDIRLASVEMRQSIVEDIDSGIKAEQCACDLRNPQGSCCLGNVRGLIKRLAQANEIPSRV